MASWAARPAERRSLATVEQGETVVVRRVLFGMLREVCAGRDVQEGDRVQCGGVDPARIFLRTPKGRTVECERDWARFVEVEPVGTDDDA